MKFKVGDKIRVANGWDGINGYTGVILIADERAVIPYNVTMDEIPPHYLEDGTTLDNWLMFEDEIELVED